MRVCSSVCLLECEGECVSKGRGWERKWVRFELPFTCSPMTGSHFSSNRRLSSIFQQWCWTTEQLWHLELLLCLPSVGFVSLSMNLPRMCWMCVYVCICVCVGRSYLYLIAENFAMCLKLASLSKVCRRQQRACHGSGSGCQVIGRCRGYGVTSTRHSAHRT